MTEAQRKILQAINIDGGVLWPRRECFEEVQMYDKGIDGRTHFVASVDDVFALLDERWIDKRGVITPAGRAALTEETGSTGSER